MQTFSKVLHCWPFERGSTSRWHQLCGNNSHVMKIINMIWWKKASRYLYSNINNSMLWDLDTCSHVLTWWLNRNRNNFFQATSFEKCWPFLGLHMPREEPSDAAIIMDGSTWNKWQHWRSSDCIVSWHVDIRKSTQKLVRKDSLKVKTRQT